MTTKKLLVYAIIILTALSINAKTDTNRLVILHTNDTHSIIDPYYENGLGGVVRRKALIDSVRSAESNVLLIDAGDVLQGSLYFTLFGGEVEQKAMNALGYDIQILGNHEFDNGMDALKKYLSGINAELLTTNYNLSATALKDLFKPYTIKEINNKRIGFLAINIEPRGLIDSVKCIGVEYLDAEKAANAIAWYLKNIEKCDYVVAISHIGYDGAISDVSLAERTENIDVIIGGHSHTLVNPADKNGLQSRFANLAGDTVIVAQTGKYGANLGEIVINLDNGHISSSIISVNNRLDNRADSSLVSMIKPYRQPVDSIFSIKLGTATAAFDKRPALMNWMADFVKDEAKNLTKKTIDLALVNVGGIRSTFPKGNITKGMIMQAFPFDNNIVVLKISGKNLAATFDSIAASGGNGVSRGVDAKIDKTSGKCSEVTINGKTIDPNKIYYVATINYLAGGNDGMEPLRYGEVIASSKNYLYNDMINAFEHGRLKGKKQTPDLTDRMHY